MKKAFTLIELLIVVIVIAVLAGIAMPMYLNSVEAAKAGKAIHSLGIIVQAENMYRAENDEYLAIGVAELLNASGLGNYTELDEVDADEFWDYSVTDTTGDTLTARATRTSGSREGEEITLDQTGIVDRGPW
jgi:prepilin-type N-terminal cleavage/methylation domain-containing protein